MKKICLSLLMLSLAIPGGCAKNGELIRTCNGSLRGDVFCEVTNPGPVPQGYTDLLVVTSLKTHKPGYHYMEDSHGTPEYRLVINIDGQAAVISGKLGKENIEPRKLRDPEAGEGIRYEFRRILRLKAGAHRLVVSIPEDVIAEEREIILPGGSRASLVLEPVYGTKRSGGRMTLGGDKDFYEGIAGFRILLNGKTL